MRRTFLTAVAIGMVFVILTADVAHGTNLTVMLPTIIDSTLKKGKQFTTDVTLTDAVDIFAWQLNITFSKSVLNVVNITLGGAWDNHPNFIVQRVNNTGGYVTYAFTYAQYPPSSASYTGTGPTAMITIRWVVMTNLGASILRFVRSSEDPAFGTIFLNSSFQPVAYSVVDGFFSNGVE